MTGYFPLDLLGVVHGPTIFEVTSGYSTSEKDFFLRKRRLLAELETGVANSRLNTDGLVVWELQYIQKVLSWWTVHNSIREWFDGHSSSLLSSLLDLLQEYPKDYP